MEFTSETGAAYWIETVEDCDSGAPWENSEGHGPVSEWTNRAKLPGELVLSRDRRSFRYYDFQEACAIARRDGWDAAPYNLDGELTARQQAARAARADYEYLRKWCADDWSYVGVIVSPICPTCKRPDHDLSQSLWGVENSNERYILEAAQELAEEIEYTQAAA